MGRTSVPPTTRRFLQFVKTQSEDYQHEVWLRIAKIEAVLEGVVGKRVNGQRCTDWWALHQAASVLKGYAAEGGFREAVELFDRLCQMADLAVHGLQSVDFLKWHAA